MAFIKREYPLTFNLDEDIYDAFENANMRNPMDGGLSGNPMRENVGHHYSNSSMEHMPLAEGSKEQHTNGMSPDDMRLPVPIKVELDDSSWNQRDSISNVQTSSDLSRSIPMSSQMANPYASHLAYQNLQNAAGYQQMFPLDLYERQAFANSFISAYSQANSSNLQYFRPDMGNPMNKEFPQFDIKRQAVFTKSEPQNPLPLVSDPKMQSLQDHKLENFNIKDEIPVPLIYDKKLMSNETTTTQLSNHFYSDKIEPNVLNGNDDGSKKSTDGELATQCSHENERNKPICYQHNLQRSDSISSEGEPVKSKYSCDDCSYTCQSTAILKIHERTHSGEKPFGCNFCHYKSGQKNNVAKHILVHMKEKPFRCQYCDYRCAQKNNLVVHERTHTGEKPFVCTYCEYKTVQKPNLVKHMYLHTNEKPFSCDVCEYRCVQKTNLLKHKQKHSTEKPYECTNCDYRCTQKANLNKHQVLHSKQKPFQCEVCAFQCAQKCNLSKHRMAKHGLSTPSDGAAKSLPESPAPVYSMITDPSLSITEHHSGVSLVNDTKESMEQFINMNASASKVS